MIPSEFCLIETALGTCALAWRETDDGPAVVGFQLPEATPERARARMARLTGTSTASFPPPAITAVVPRAPSPGPAGRTVIRF